MKFLYTLTRHRFFLIAGEWSGCYQDLFPFDNTRKKVFFSRRFPYYHGSRVYGVVFLPVRMNSRKFPDLDHP
jgi:hypothetical protein